MNVLITGGSGFIGRALCKAMHAEGVQISVLTRQPDRARAALPPGTRCIATLDDARDIDTVINLQGEPLAAGRWNARLKAEFVRSRVDFTRELVGWMRRQPVAPATLVNGSAIGWYGDRGEEILQETSTPGTDFAARLCQDWETEAERAAGFGTRVCRVRIGIVLDRDGGALTRMLPAFRLGAGGPLGPGSQWMSWIARRDLIRMIQWLALTPGLSGVFNATAPTPVINREFTRILAATLHRPALLPMPAIALRLLFGEMAGLLLGSQRVLPAAAEHAGFGFELPELGPGLDAILAA